MIDQTELIEFPKRRETLNTQSYQVSLLRLYDGYIERTSVTVDCTIPDRPDSLVIKLQVLGWLPEWSIYGVKTL